MTRSRNRRRPRSGAPPLPPEKQEKADRLHSEIFGRDENTLPAPGRGGWLRHVVSFGLAALAWILGETLDNYYLLIFALAIAGSSVGVIIVRAVDSRKRGKNDSLPRGQNR